MDQKLILEQLEKDLEQLCATPMGRRMFIASMPLLLSGCATVSSNRHREGNNDGQKTSMSVNDEKRMTREYLPKMKKDYPPYKSRFLQSYINRIGQNIVTANGLGGRPYDYSFTLVETKMVNAFALPAGTVYVTGPLLTMASSEAELAGVLGHEIGHIKARHTAERMDLAKKKQSSSLLIGLGGAILGGVAGYALGKATCAKKDKECLERATKYGVMAGGAGGLLITKYGFMANSREDEMEADRIGFRTSVAAGYHKDHVGRFYEKLLGMEEKRKKGSKSGALASFADAMSTHPPSRERVTQMNAMARTQNLMKNTRITSADFKKAKRLILELNKA
jgi:predicted Zn-dependent protease